MKQLIQHIRTGEAEVIDVPAPKPQPGQILVRVAASLVSAGTERMVVEFAERSLLDKARARPDLVRQVLDKARREGLLTTLDAVRHRLDTPMALGYSVAGTVVAVAGDVGTFRIGDRVAAAGGGHAVHAELVTVPVNLAVPLPASVEFISAAFATLGAIALQGIRLADVKLGETVAVIGLGLLGQLTVGMLRASGCVTVGFDPREDRVALAVESGASEATSSADGFESACAARTAGRGVDAVIITADTPSSEPVQLAGRIARDKGIVVPVGAVGLEVPRKTYYEKELDLRISRSYGPGRYDEAYEERGIDYPYGYVRWTENRNMRAFVELLAEGRVRTSHLVSHKLPISSGADAYSLILGKTGEPVLGVVLEYPQEGGGPVPGHRLDLAEAARPPIKGEVVAGVLGAGNFATAVLLPAMRDAGVRFAGVATASGLSARHTGSRFGFRFCTTDPGEVLANAETTLVVIATRHHLHASQVISALEAGKHVFVEKPLCLTSGELDAIVAAYEASAERFGPRMLMVGFNRRFAPMALRARAFFEGVGDPVFVHYRANAGYLPATHWTQDPRQGGGRLLGEAIHFIDWALWFTGADPSSVHATALADGGRYHADNLAISITFANGSVAQLAYLANGDRAFGKERVEVHGGGRSAVIDDYRRLELVHGGRRQVARAHLRQDKGHGAEWRALVEALRAGHPSPVPFDQAVLGMRTAFACLESLARGTTVQVACQKQ